MPLTMHNVYPLILQPTLLAKVWGGDRLAAFGKKVAPGARVGESWELADLPATSASGAGGGAARSIVRNGPLAGRTLHDAMTLWGGALCYEATLKDAAGNVRDYPLLVKFLDAREDLSVQVHPSPEYASAHAGAHLKTECWLILAAEPGSVIYKGVKPGVTRASFERSIRDNTVVNNLIAAPARVGECHNLPSGTVHALGKGVLVAEVQTPSDTTFRVYDWGRAGRELHIAEALECIAWGPAGDARGFDRSAEHGGSLVTDYFRIEQYSITTRPLPLSVESGCAMIVLAGRGRVESGGAGGMAGVPVAIGVGDTVFLPMAWSGSGRIVREGDGPLVVLFAVPAAVGPGLPGMA